MNKEKNKIIALIPARGGSKGIRRKNIYPLYGKPLIAYTIEESLKSMYLDCLIDCVIVSTEDQEIANISKKYGARVIERPEILAQDETPMDKVVLHIIDTLEHQINEQTIIVLLQPTSPLRNSQDIQNAIDLFQKNECDSVISFFGAEKTIFWAHKIENGYLQPINENFSKKIRRQDLEKFYLPNGAIYVSTVKNLKKNGSFYSGKILPYLMPDIRSIDIDDDSDIIMAEAILSYLQK
jgi:N-acylneuraminate cytidylyltransferase